MATQCANCGSYNIQHGLDRIQCYNCGKSSWEDDSGVVEPDAPAREMGANEGVETQVKSEAKQKADDLHADANADPEEVRKAVQDAAAERGGPSGQESGSGVTTTKQARQEAAAAEKK